MLDTNPVEKERARWISDVSISISLDSYHIPTARAVFTDSQQLTKDPDIILYVHASSIRDSGDTLLSRKFKKLKKGRKPKYDLDNPPSEELLEHDLKMGKISESTYYRYRKLISACAGS
jgi:hypothetical protein